MTTRVCKFCGGSFACGLNDDPNVCTPCQLLEGFSNGAGVPTTGRKVATSPPCPAPSAPEPIRCAICQSAAPLLIVSGGRSICPMCDEQEKLSGNVPIKIISTLPAASQEASNIPTSPIPQSANSPHKNNPDSRAIAVANGSGAGFHVVGAAAGQFLDGHSKRVAIGSAADVCATTARLTTASHNRSNVCDGGKFWSAIL